MNSKSSFSFRYSELLCGCVFFLLLTTATPTQAEDTNSDLSEGYLRKATVNQVYELMRANVFTRDDIDWVSLKLETDQKMLIPTEESMQQSIFNILEKADTGHSFYRSESEPRFIMHRKYSCSEDIPPLTQIPADIGYIRVNGFNKPTEEDQMNFVKDIRNSLREKNTNDLAGWIVDLRYNKGGNMWPMLAGIAPLLSNGIHGYFLKADGKEIPWGTQDGYSILSGHPVIGIPAQGSPEYSSKPIAILSSQRTASSGEAILVAFKGKSNTKSFGNDSCGLSTSNKPFNLVNGAVLNITTGVMMSTEKVRFGSKIDVEVKTQSAVSDAIEWIYSLNTRQG